MMAKSPIGWYASVCASSDRTLLVASTYWNGRPNGKILRAKQVCELNDMPSQAITKLRNMHDKNLPRNSFCDLAACSRREDVEADVDVDDSNESKVLSLDRAVRDGLLERLTSKGGGARDLRGEEGIGSWPE